MMSNINNNTTANNASSKQAKEEELKAFERSFFPAGGPSPVSQIPQAPPLPKKLNNVRAAPLSLKTRNWDRSHVASSSYDNDNLSTLSRSTSNIPVAPPLPRWNKTRSNDNYLIKGKRLRIRNWGTPEKKGWSNSNRRMYRRKNGLNLELNVIINELWAQYQPKNKGMERAIDQQLLAPAPEPVFVQQQIQPVRSSLVSAVTTTQVVPLTQNVASINRGVAPFANIRGGIPLSTNTTAGAQMMSGTATILTPGLTTVPVSSVPLVAGRLPTKKELRTQQKLLKKQNKRDAKLMKKGKLPLATQQTMVLPVPRTVLEPIVTAPLVNNRTIDLTENYGYTSYGGVAPTTTGIIGPVSTTTTVLPNHINSFNTTSVPFIKQEPAFVNVPNSNLVGMPMM